MWKLSLFCILIPKWKTMLNYCDPLSLTDSQKLDLMKPKVFITWCCWKPVQASHVTFTSNCKLAIRGKELETS